MLVVKSLQMVVENCLKKVDLTEKNIGYLWIHLCLGIWDFWFGDTGLTHVKNFR